MKKLLIILSFLFFILPQGQSQVLGVFSQPSATYTVLRTFRCNLGSQFATSPSSPAWNNIAVNGTTIQTDNNYTSSNLVTEIGGASTVNLTIPNHWQSTTGSGPTPATVDAGIYPNSVISQAFVYDGSSADPSIQFNGLNTSLVYTAIFHGDAESWRNAVVYWYSGTTQSTQINESNNWGSNSVGEATSPALVRVKNVTCDGTGHLKFSMHQVSGSGSYCNAVVLIESNIPSTGFIIHKIQWQDIITKSVNDFNTGDVVDAIIHPVKTEAIIRRLPSYKLKRIAA